MKFILALNDEINGIELQFFNSKEELLKYLTEDEYSNWKLIQTVDWNNFEKYTKVEAEYIAYKKDLLDNRTEAYLRVVKGQKMNEEQIELITPLLENINIDDKLPIDLNLNFTNAETLYNSKMILIGYEFKYKLSDFTVVVQTNKDKIIQDIKYI